MIHVTGLRVDVTDRFGCTALYYAALTNRVHNVTVRSRRAHTQQPWSNDGVRPTHRR